jgi:hypothetical protein
MSLPIANNNAAAAITVSGNFCPISTWQPQTAQQGSGQFSCTLIKDARFMFTSGGTATGNVNVQELGGDGTWRTLSDVATIALGAALTYSGSISGSFHGLRLAVTSLAVANITYAEVRGTVVTF